MLKVDITGLSYEPKEYEFEGSRVFIRPFPFSKTDYQLHPDGSLTISGAQRWECFDYCLRGWDFVGSDDNPLPCNTETKKVIFDFKLLPGLNQLVFKESDFFNLAKSGEEKNFTSGPDTSSEE